MDAESYSLQGPSKRLSPLQLRRKELADRLLLLVSATALACLVASLVGYRLPAPRELWDGLLALAQALVRPPA